MELLSAVYSSTVVGHFIIISGKRGYGKSSLVKEVFEEKQIDYIHLYISQAETKEEVSAGTYIKLICREILNVLPDDALSTYLRGEVIGDESINLILAGVFEAIGFFKTHDRYKAKVNEIPNKIKTLIYDDLVILDVCVQFIEYYISKNPFILFIENFHQIDPYSLGKLIHIADKFPKAKILCEYVTENDSDLKVSINELHSHELVISLISLERLDKEELVKCLVEKKNYVTNLILNTYDNSNGNLKHFSILYESDLDVFKVDKYDQAILSFLKGLKSSYRFILISINEHNGAVDKNILIEYMSKINIGNDIVTYKDIEVLKVAKLVINRSGKLTLAHDSISDELEKFDDFNKIRLISLREWLRFYQKIEEFDGLYGVDRLTNLLHQLYFKVKLKATSEISDSFRLIVNLIGSNSYLRMEVLIDAVCNFLLEEKDAQLDQSIVNWLITMYYRCGLMSKVLTLERHSDSNASSVASILTAKSSLNRNEEVISYCTDRLRVRSISNTMKLVCYLNKIRALRSNNLIAKSSNLWTSCLRSEIFANTAFEGDFYRYIALAEHNNYSTRIYYLEKSLSLFRQNNNHNGLISVCMNLARDYCFVGKLEQASKYFNLAMDNAKSILYPWYIILNNQVVLSMLLRKTDYTLNYSLKAAQRVCEIDGDRSILLSNLIALCIYNDDEIVVKVIEDNLDILVNSINYNSETDCRLLYHSKLASSKFGRRDLLEIFDLHLRKMKILKNKAVWDYLLGHNSVNPYPSVLINKLYPCFMINWNIDYYNVLDNY